MITLTDLKKAKMNALKEKNKNAQAVLGIVISAYQQSEIEKKAKNAEMTDADMIAILNRTVKSLKDERDMYVNAAREEDIKNCDEQIAIVKSYLPSMMSEEEVRKVIENLSDKSVKSIMVEFKTKYAAKADMALVNRLAKEYQGK